MKMNLPWPLLPLLLVPALLVAQDAPHQQDQSADPGAAVVPQDARDRVYYPGDTERVKPLGRKLLGNVLLDQKAIWTSPFHMNRDNAKWWLTFGAATAALVVTDRLSSNALENTRTQKSWGENVSQIGAAYTVIPLAAGFYGFGVLKDDPKARETGVLGAEALLDSLIVVEVLKPIAGRKRPDAATHRGNWFSGGNSFPSGHSIETWSFAAVIAEEYKHTRWVPIVAYGLAGVVSTSRIVAVRHYASDVVAGGAMGWFIGRYVYRTHVDHSIHKHAWYRPMISPQVQPGTNTYGVWLTFVPGE